MARQRKNHNASAPPRRRGRPPAERPSTNPAVTAERRPSSAAPLNIGEIERRRAAFLTHRRRIEQIYVELMSLKATLKKAERDAKAEGFKPVWFHIARDLTGFERKEAKVEGEVHDRLTVAYWLGHGLGRQLDLFTSGLAETAKEAPDPYADGRQAGMEGKTASPPNYYSIESEQYIRWMEGYHDATGQRVRAGITVPDSVEEAAGTPVIDEAMTIIRDSAEAVAGFDPGRPLEEAAAA